jgi:CheY-like chemotaxis protein
MRSPSDGIALAGMAHAVQTRAHCGRQPGRRLGPVGARLALGHVVAVAENGRDAVMTAKAFHPDVAILDLDMPLMDGFEAARALRNREDHAVIIALTGLPPGLLPERMLGSCFDHQFFKPLPTEQLRRVLERD